MTSDELRVASEEETADGRPPTAEMSPAMREWKEKLAAGYRIGPRLRMGPHGYLEWGPALFNAEGAFVQNVRRDTVTKLMRLGVLSDERRVTSGPTGVGEGEAAAQVEEPDADSSADDEAGDGRGLGGDSE